MLKTCNKCKAIKNVSEFCKEKKTKDGLHSRCKTCSREYKNAWRKKNWDEIKLKDKIYRESLNKEEMVEYQKNWYLDNKVHCLEKSKMNYEQNKRAKRNSTLKVKYGITIEEYESMLNSQNNKCAICHNVNFHINSSTNKTTNLAVDHCHKTGRVRGLLCMICNRVIGMFNDDVLRLENAIKYLRN